MLAEAAAEFGGDDPEIGDFHRVVLRDAPQLVPPREVGLRAGPARGHEELNGGVGEVLRDLVVRPVPPVEPMEGLTDRAIAYPVQLGPGVPDTRDREFGKRPELRLELRAILELQVRLSCLHARNLCVRCQVSACTPGTWVPTP